MHLLENYTHILYLAMSRRYATDLHIAHIHIHIKMLVHGLNSRKHMHKKKNRGFMYSKEILRRDKQGKHGMH